MANLPFIRLGTISMVVAVAMMACSPKPSRKITVTNPETGEKTEVSVSDGMFSKDKEINITSKKDGASVKITQGSIPSSLPAYIVPYPGGTDLSTMQASENKGGADKSPSKMTMLNFKSRDNAQKIIDFYTEKLTPHGYKQEASMNMGNMHMATLVNEANKQGLQIVVTKHSENGDSVVQLIYGSEVD